jgi:hypothetical protein
MGSGAAKIFSRATPEYRGNLNCGDRIGERYGGEIIGEGLEFSDTGNTASLSG